MTRLVQFNVVIISISHLLVLEVWRQDGTNCGWCVVLGS